VAGNKKKQHEAALVIQLGLEPEPSVKKLPGGQFQRRCQTAAMAGNKKSSTKLL